MSLLLKKGTRDPQVSEWQNFLRGQGYADVVADGIFGDATEVATRMFQVASGLREDGLVGDMTRAAATLKGFRAVRNPAPIRDLQVGTMPAGRKRMYVSPKGRDFIKSFEREILKVYDDGYGFLTVGIGHLVKPEDGLKLGDVISKAQSAAFFAKDLAEHAKPVDDLVKVPLTQGQYDALVSLVFNIGGSNFKKSSVLRELNAGNYEKARDQFDDWVNSNGQKSRGLIRRRNEEQTMFDEKR
jgi:lysozyme